MLIQPLPVIKTFIDDLNTSLQLVSPSARLTAIQKVWLGTVLMGIIVTGMLNWAAFERRSLGEHSQNQLRWMFGWAKIKWELLLTASVMNILETYGIKSGTLVADDSDKRRSKTTKCIPDAHKIKDKRTGGYFNGQELIFLIVVSNKVTFPIGVCFYVPDPALSKWNKENTALKDEGVEKKDRPKKPIPNPAYPTKPTLTVQMIKEFVEAFPSFKIIAVLADALYGQSSFIDQVGQLTKNAQVVTQLKNNQLVKNKKGKWVQLKTYFVRQEGVKATLLVRGGKKVNITILSARLSVKAHDGKRRFIVALKYEGETKYRFLVASDLSWRHQDIAQLYTLRWLVEVFIQDWKGFEGWNQLAKQQGEKGSTRGVILSLLCDHLLLHHPKQIALLKNKQPGMPVGCLIEHLNAEALVETIRKIVIDEKPLEKFKLFAENLYEILPERQSKKHMAGLDLGRMEPTTSLVYQNAL